MRLPAAFGLEKALGYLNHILAVGPRQLGIPASSSSAIRPSDLLHGREKKPLAEVSGFATTFTSYEGGGEPSAPHPERSNLD